MMLIKFGLFIALSVYFLFDEVRSIPVPPPGNGEHDFPYVQRQKLHKRSINGVLYDPKEKLPSNTIDIHRTKKKRAIDKVIPPQTLPYDPDDGLKKKKRSIDQKHQTQPFERSGGTMRKRRSPDKDPIRQLFINGQSSPHRSLRKRSPDESAPKDTFGNSGHP